MSVSIHSGFCSPGTVVRFNPTYILIPETHEGNQRVHTGPELKHRAAVGCSEVFIRHIPSFYPFLISSLF